MNEILLLLQENAIEIICSAAVIIGIITGKVKSAEKAQQIREKKLARLKKKESKQSKGLQKTLKKEAKLEKEIEKNA